MNLPFKLYSALIIAYSCFRYYYACSTEETFLHFNFNILDNLEEMLPDRYYSKAYGKVYSKTYGKAYSKTSRLRDVK